MRVDLGIGSNENRKAWQMPGFCFIPKLIVSVASRVFAGCDVSWMAISEGNRTVRVPLACCAATISMEFDEDVL